MTTLPAISAATVSMIGAIGRSRSVFMVPSRIRSPTVQLVCAKRTERGGARPDEEEYQRLSHPPECQEEEEPLVLKPGSPGMGDKRQRRPH